MKNAFYLLSFSFLTVGLSHAEQINFNELTIIDGHPVSSQPSSPAPTIAPDGLSLSMPVNSHKYFSITDLSAQTNYPITADTRIAFDLKIDSPSGDEGEIIGIGVAGGSLTAGSPVTHHTFKVAGIQALASSWTDLTGDYPQGDRNTLQDGYFGVSVNVAAHLSGDFDYLVLVNDDDRAIPTTTISIRNLRLYEASESISVIDAVINENLFVDGDIILGGRMLNPQGDLLFDTNFSATNGYFEENLTIGPSGDWGAPGSYSISLGTNTGIPFQLPENGNYNFRQGHNTWVNGEHSFAKGNNILVRGQSFAQGENINLSSTNSSQIFAFGKNISAHSSPSLALMFGDTVTNWGSHYSIGFGQGVANYQNDYSVVIGSNLASSSMHSLTIGRTAKWGPWWDNDWQWDQPLLNLGNGETSEDTNVTPHSYSSALITLKNGQTTLTNKFWDEAAPTGSLLTETPGGDVVSPVQASHGEALVVEGHTRLRGKVTIEQPQGDISMGIYGVN